MAKKHILIDACVAAAAFAPRTTRSAHLVNRASTLLNGTGTDCQPQFLIANFCIGETFAMFEKYRWGASWNEQVKDKTRLTQRQFRSARDSFHKSIHNGTKLLQIELNRYHVLCLDLISPINAAYRIKRNRKKHNKPVKKQVTPASTYDLLLVAMGMWLQRQLGPENFVVATGDQRLAMVVKRAKSVNLGRPIRHHLRDVATRLGLTYGPEIYPQVVDLVHAKKNELEAAFPGWDPAW